MLHCVGTFADDVKCSSFVVPIGTRDGHRNWCATFIDEQVRLATLLALIGSVVTGTFAPAWGRVTFTVDRLQYLSG